MIIREMLPKEIDVVLSLMRRYADEVNIDDAAWDLDRARHTVREYVIRPNLFFRVACQGQRPVGVIGGFLSEDPVESVITATIQFHYLIEEFATDSAYHTLIQEFQDWADLCQVRQIRVIDIGSAPQRLHDVYSQLGYRPVRLTMMNKDMT